MTHKSLRAFALKKIEELQQDLDEFSEDFKKSPVWALRWGLQTFEAATQQQEWKRLIVDYESYCQRKPNNTLEEFLLYWNSHITSEIMRSVISPINNSSPCFNLISVMEQSAKSIVLHQIRDFVGEQQ